MNSSHKKKCSLLKELIFKEEVGILMEAHNGLSAKISEEAGFLGIWASGLSISTAHGLRDSNELSITQNLDILETMSDSVDIPILFDGDTGFGNFNNARRMVKKLEQRSISGVIIEDKLFPKTNSFIGENQPLADVDEMCGKLAAMCDVRDCDHFQIVARCESFIAGCGLADALDRTARYREAGADAVFIHSKKRDASEIFAFAKVSQGAIPLIATPTTYYRTPFKDLWAAGISAIICANQNMRASTMAMRAVAREILSTQTLESVEKSITPLADIFSLMNYRELDQASEIYLPKARPDNTIDDRRLSKVSGPAKQKTL